MGEPLNSDFYRRIDDFVRRQLDGYVPQKSSEKIIHDPIWGSVLYYGWEIQVIDSPLLQRLRNISQLGTADLTYTAARHSRFEHSLGTAAVAGRMMSKLQQRYKGDPDIHIDDSDVYKVRMAAILHDVGHCFYSHLSEGVYSSLPEFVRMREELLRRFPEGLNPKPHELFSYLIITSDAFTEFFFRNIDYPGKKDISQIRKMLAEAANMVVGVANRDSEGTVLSYMTAVMNGEFDADKLDYTQRDSYTAGIAMTYGAERFLMKLIILSRVRNGEKTLELAIDADSLTTVEELIFNRNILYVYMYRHQKVLAAEACIRDIIYGMINLGILSHPCDFLNYGDSFLSSLEDSRTGAFANAPEVTLSYLAGNVRNRILPKRCYELTGEKLFHGEDESLCRSLAEKYAALSPDEKTGDTFMRFAAELNALRRESGPEGRIGRIVSVLGDLSYEKYTRVREEFCGLLGQEYEKAGKKADFTPLDVHIVMPKTYSSKISFPLVSKDGRVRSTNTIRYISDWSESFGAEKWKGYFFCSNRIDRVLGEKAAKNLIFKECGVMPD